MEFSKKLVIRESCKKRVSIKEAPKNCEYNTYTKNIMEMGYYIVSIVKRHIDS
jgi:hypothetical protein